MFHDFHKRIDIHYVYHHSSSLGCRLVAVVVVEVNALFSSVRSCLRELPPLLLLSSSPDEALEYPSAPFMVSTRSREEYESSQDLPSS